MVTRAERMTEFTTDSEPHPGFSVEVLCEDHNGTYVLPFPCYRSEGVWRNKGTDEALQAAVVGWRMW